MPIRASAFNPDINPQLLKLVEEMQYGPYEVRANSGYRPGDPRQHGRGQAIDIQLIDPKTKAELANYQDPSTFKAYQEYANALYSQAQKSDPELAQKLRWGGYFGGPKGKYGAMDLMHFDTAGDIGMAGGSWQGGLNPEQAKLWNISAGGGLDAQMAAAGYTPEQRRNAIASIESQGSGGYAATGAWTGDPQDGRDRAYGRYQIMGKNVGPWAEQYLKQSGVTPEQFLADPALQDKLFDAVYGSYADQYGERGAASKWFTGSENEPARTDVNGKLTGKTYADRYMEALGAPAPASTGGAPAGGATPGATPTAPAAKKSFGDKFTAGLADTTLPATSATPTGITDLPKAALAAAQPTTFGQPGVEGEDPRQKLAMAMARLNAGKLWV